MRHGPLEVTRLLPVLPALMLFAGRGAVAQEPLFPPRPLDTASQVQGSGAASRQEALWISLGNGGDMSRTDVQLTGKVRRLLVNDASLSTYAHNVRIITRSGEVTLRGPVRTPEERSLVEERAREAGCTSVRNELEVVPESTPR